MIGWVEVTAIAENELLNSAPGEAEVAILPATPKASVKLGENGKPVISWVDNGDAIIYEMHIREYTVHSTSGVKEQWRGKYLGMTQQGTSYQGHATGLDHLKELGVTTAYALDGGQTSTIVTGNKLINPVDYGGERETSDIIYFATAVPDGG